MAETFEPKSVVPSGEFNMQKNPDSLIGVQANETFMLNAQQGHVLGSTGETRGFAKYQFAPNPQLDVDLNAATNARSQALQDPDATRYSMLAQQMSDIPGQVEVGERRVDTLQKATPRDDDELQKAQLNLAQLKAALQQNPGEMAQLQQKASVQAYIKSQQDYETARAKHQQLQDASYATSDLFGDRKKQKLDDPANGGDRSMLSRSVASKTVDNFLGTGSVAEEKFGVDGNGHPIGISVQTDGAGVTGTHQGKNAFLNVDYSDPLIQKGLSDLEVNDYITGQLDRHTGNIFIDPVTKKVVGIDNDLAFPDYDREKAVKGPTGGGKAIPGLPATMHKETADRIAGLDPNALREQLKNMPTPNGVGKLSDASIEGSVDRLKKIQAAIKSGEIEVVNQFDKRTYDAAIDKQNAVVKKNCDGKDLAQLGPEDNHGLRNSPPTSYLGSCVVQGKKYELGEQLEPHKFGPPRPENSVQKAQRNPNYAEFAKLEKAQRESARTQISKPYQQQSDDLNASLAKYQKRLEKLENPGPLNAIRSLRYKGLDGARKAFAEKRDNTFQEIRTLNKKIDDEVNQSVDPQKKDLYKQAGEKVPKQQQSQGNVQDLALNQNEAQQLLKALNKFDKGPKQKDGGNLDLSEQEATQLLQALDKLSQAPKQNSRQSLSLSDQEAGELMKALNNLSKEDLQQASKKSTTVKVTDEQLEKMIQDLKDMDLDAPSEDHSVGKVLNMKHNGSGPTEQTLKTGQKQDGNKPHPTRQDFKPTGPKKAEGESVQLKTSQHLG